MALTITCTLPADVAVAGTSRLAAAELLRAIRADESLIEEVLLVVSELVTNAVVHAGSVVDLTITIEDDQVRIEVGDRASAHPARRTTDAETVGGHGLHLVDQSATEWGVEPRPDGHAGKVVWAVLRR